MRQVLLLIATFALPTALLAQETNEPAPAASDTTAAPAAEQQPASEPQQPASDRPENLGETPPPATPSTQELTTIPVPQAAPEAPPTEAGSAQLDEVVVTAQKVKQPLRKVPLSVSTFD